MLRHKMLVTYKTQICSYAFGVGEGNSDGAIWISLEPRGEKPEILTDCDISFALPEWVDDISIAQDIANYLNENVGDLCLTFPSLQPSLDDSMGDITKH